MLCIASTIVQAGPIPLDISGGIESLLDYIIEAADGGARLIAFGKTFLGGCSTKRPARPFGIIPGARRCIAFCWSRRFAMEVIGWRRPMASG